MEDKFITIDQGEWVDEEPTPHLRWVKQPAVELQQMWRIKIFKNNILQGIKEEWRDVPEEEHI